MKRTNNGPKNSFLEGLLACLFALWVCAIGLIILVLPFATLVFIVWLVTEALK